MKEIKFRMRITKVGESYYIRVPKHFVKYGMVDPNKTYEATLVEVSEAEQTQG